MQFLYDLTWGFILILVLLSLSLGYTGFFFFGSDKKNSLETERVPWKKRINAMTCGSVFLLLLALAATIVKLAA